MNIFDRALAILRRAEPIIPRVLRRAARGGRGVVVGDLPLWQQLQRIGGSLTPAQVSDIIRQADTGRMAPLMDLANEVRQKDCHLQSVLATSEQSIAGLPWELELPESPKLKERKAAEWIEGAFRTNATFPTFLAHQAGARYYGYAVSELIYAVDGSRLYPRTFRPVFPRRFIFALETGKLHWWDLAGGMAYPGVDFQDEYPDKFVVSQPRINGDVACREGLVRPLMWAALFRNWSLADWVKLGEIAWKPWRTASYAKENASDDEVENLVSVLETMSASGIAVVPESTKLSIEWPKGGHGSGGSMHHELFQVVGMEMSKAVLGQTLTTEQTKVGSQALGNVHNEVRKDLREASARAIANDIDRDVIGPMMRLNFGPDIRPPSFRFLTEDPADLSSFSLSIKTLVDAGLRIPAEWVRSEAGIPEPEDDDELVRASQETPPPEGPAPAQGPAGDEATPAGDKPAPAAEAA